jgi:hypothetical protein
MASYVPAEIRRIVAERANHLCEYCLVHEDDRGFGCQVDHIISEKHGGQTDADNLAYACAPCNRAKGSNVGSIAERSGIFTRLYNPRVDKWHEHFKLDGSRVVGVSEIGDVTVKTLRLNDDDRLLEREVLYAKNRYPSADAASRIAGRS